MAVLARMDEVRLALMKTVLPKSPLGEALGYLDNQWRVLNRFVEDGRLAIDNNGAENQLRVVAVRCEKPVTLPGRTREPHHRADRDAGYEPRRTPSPAPMAEVSGGAA